jgi:excinuclease ABC subunit A
MALSIEQACQIFKNEKNIYEPLSAAMRVGLGYLTLSQPGHTLSGGEAQRLKIAVELSKRIHNDTLYILDEPTIGQHLEDVNRLISVLQHLVNTGQSVLVVEHHPHVLAACDWLVELGPGGGPDGGRIIATGTPETIAGLDTPTAPYLREILKGGI